MTSPVAPDPTSLTQTSVDGLNNVTANYTQASAGVYDFFNDQMDAINAVLNLPNTAGAPASTQLANSANQAQLVSDFQTSVQKLISGAQNGVQIGIDSSGKPIIDYYTVSMDSDLDNFLRTLQSAAAPTDVIDPSTNTVQISAPTVEGWLDFANATPAILQIMNNMNNENVVGASTITDAGLTGIVNSQGELETGSIQAMVELLYVQAGNNLMADNLDTLESALNTNQQALTALNTLQNLHSQLAALPPGNQPLDTGAATGNDTGIDAGTITTLSTGTNISTFYSAILPQLGPGLADAYTILEGYETAANSAFNGNPPYVDSPPASPPTPILSPLGASADPLANYNSFAQMCYTIQTIESSYNNDPTTFTDADRQALVSAISTYNNVAIPYTNAVNQLNTLIQPYVDIINGGPNGPPVTLTINNLTITVPIPANQMPPLPGFTSDQIPYPINSTEYPQSGTSQQISSFFTTLLTPFANQLPTVTLDSSNFFTGFTSSSATTTWLPSVTVAPFPTTGATTQADDYASQIYSQYGSLLANGNGSEGPLEAFTMATQAQQQLQVLQAQITALSTDPTQTSGPDTLLGQLKQVVADLQNSGVADLPNVSGFGDVASTASSTQIQSFITSISTFANSWVLDNLNSSASANSGKIQQDLDSAITASQSLNSQQQADTSNFLFLFQEFYQSASSALQSITDLITKMADNINR